MIDERNPYLLIEWKEISQLTHYSSDWCRRKFGPELKAMGIVTVKYINYTNESGVLRRKRVAFAPKYLLEHYFLDKKQKGQY